MIGQIKDGGLAVAAGVLLALMIEFNSLLARHTTPVFASWIAHGIGAVVAFLLVVLPIAALAAPPPAADQAPRPQAPAWFYLGGIPGAFTVVLAAITVNGPLSLSGTIALILVGQIVFGLLSDHFGLFRMPRRPVVAGDALVVCCVLAGSLMIVFGGA